MCRYSPPPPLTPLQPHDISSVIDLNDPVIKKSVTVFKLAKNAAGAEGGDT